MKFLMILTASMLFSFNSLALECHGTEPFWAATITEDEVALDQFGDLSTLPVTSLSAAAGYTSEFMTIYSNNNGPVALVKGQACDDSMSDFEYPEQVIIFTPTATLYGCCGEGISTL